MLGYLILAFIIIIVYLLSKININETFLTEPTLPPLEETYQRQLNELEDVDRVLDRPTKPGDKYVENLKLPLEGAPISDKYQHLVKLKRKTFDFKDIVDKPVSEDDLVKVEDKQPYMFDEPVIVDYYGTKNYWDWRFPRKPISIKFLENPEEFCKRHPDQYPSYVIASRIQLK